jgi:hypothetical protein
MNTGNGPTLRITSVHPLPVDTNLNDDVRINTYQHGDRVFTHDAVIHSGSNEVTLQYPSGLIDTGEFRVCVRAIDLINQSVIMHIIQKLSSQNMFTLICLQMM